MPVLRLVALLSPLAFMTSANVLAETFPLVLGETFRLRSAVLEEDRVINVYRPPGVSEDTPLPVLYMPDGGMGEDFLHVAGLVQISVVNGTMRPHLLVGIENTERRRDLTGPSENESDRKIASRIGGSASFRRFLRNELLPEVDRRYTTTGERAIVGESLAGLFVVETLLLEADLFDTYVAVDPSLWWNDQRMVEKAAQSLREQHRQVDPGLQKTLFLVSGSTEGIATPTRQLAAALENMAGDVPGLVWHHLELPEESHRTIYHPAALRAFRQVLAPGTLFLRGERKTTLATLLRAEAGDRACYLDLLDRDGEPFQELADFAICEQRGILGKRIRLAYAEAGVPAAACGGDPDCDQSERVILVNRAEALRLYVPTHCRDEETLVFSCGTTEQRVLSICASATLTVETGTLQYRFGKYGEAPSLIFPDSPEHPKKHFRSGTLAFSGSGGAYLKFFRNGSAWVVFTGIGKGWRKEGLVVREAGKETVEFPCRSEWMSEMGPEFFESSGIPADPEGFDIPGV